MKFNDTLENIKTYEAGKPIELVVREYGIEPKDIIKLASNENPHGCSKSVQKAVGEIVSKMALYPDDSMIKLKSKLSAHYGVAQNEIVIGSGSDQVIEFAVHAKASPHAKILMNKITFAMYEIYAKHVGAEVIRTTSTHHDLEEFYRLYKEHKPQIIFICTPNNPTGDAIDREELESFLDKIDKETLVVVDGAYMEYAAYRDPKKSVDPKALIAAYENVLYLGTFSKAYGLGGMRIGYGLANERIIQALYKLRPPFNITTLSLEAATIALEDQDFVAFSVKDSFEQMERYEEFAKAKKIDIIQSFTNFVTLCLEEPLNASHIAKELLKQGMIVRDLSSYGLNAIRVTIGTQEQNSRFFALFEALL